jgi:hypothetical protein
MKVNRWTMALASTGVISLGSVAYAEEQMSQVLTAVSQTTLGGYVDTSIAWKPGTGNGGALGGSMPARFNDGSAKADGFNLNVVGLTVERPLGEETWDAGYRADILFGPDAVAYNPSANGDATTDLAVKQAYVNLLVPIGNGLQFKAGVFNTIIGYESYESYLNPNYGRSYGWQLEPTQHTGLLASYQVSEAISVSAGLANTWIAGINARSARGETFKTYMASLAITAPDSWGFLSGSSWSIGVVNGDAGTASTTGTQRNTTSFYTGFNVLTGLEGLSLGAAFDYRANGLNVLTPTLTGDAKNYAFALAGYLSFQASEKWKLNARLDYTKGSDGTYYDGGGTWTAGVYTGNGLSDSANEIFGTTLTADYALWANVLSRLELRWDHSAHDAPFGDSDENAVTVTANFVYKF